MLSSWLQLELSTATQIVLPPRLAIGPVDEHESRGSSF